jgi:hypothetical protein
MIREGAKVVVLQRRTFFALSSSQLIDAVVPSHLREPGAQWHRLIPLVQNSVKLQEDLRRGILGVFPLAKILPANLQNVTMVSGVTCSQEFRADCSRFVQEIARLGIANG